MKISDQNNDNINNSPPPPPTLRPALREDKAEPTTGGLGEVLALPVMSGDLSPLSSLSANQINQS